VPAGFAELDFRRPGIGELALFGLIPDYIGQGLGGWFLDWAVHALWRPGVERAVVDTNSRDHPRALAMYQKAGFEVVRRETSWLAPADDA
jgi:GNAT superfamily N-acetyltransferase